MRVWIMFVSSKAPVSLIFTFLQNRLFTDTMELYPFPSTTLIFSTLTVLLSTVLPTVTINSKRYLQWLLIARKINQITPLYQKFTVIITTSNILNKYKYLGLYLKRSMLGKNLSKNIYEQYCSVKLVYWQ